MIARKTVALFKQKSTTPIPRRKGPLQCVRNCPNCSIQADKWQYSDFEEIIRLTSYDNLVARASTWFSRYQAIQYHTGQLDMLRRALNGRKAVTIYIVASTGPSDLNLLNQILGHVDLPRAKLLLRHVALEELEELFKLGQCIALPIELVNCVTDAKQLNSQFEFFDAVDLRDLLCLPIDLVSTNPELPFNIVPVAITKDHDRRKLHGIGSACVQIMEPYDLNTYLDKQPEIEIDSHFTQHILHDIYRNAVVLPPHMVAFLILNQSHEEGISFSNLVSHVDWFRKTSSDTGMHIGFTGDSASVVEFGLLILKDFIKRTGELYQATAFDKLADYAILVTPMISHLGVVAKSILVEHNRSSPEILTQFTPDKRVRVMRDRVVDSSVRLANRIQEFINCKRPCVSTESVVLNCFDQMHLFGRYFKIEEPSIVKIDRRHAWAGDSGSDDEYLMSNRNNPALQTWLLLTQTEGRLDRLNMCINAIELFIQ